MLKVVKFGGSSMADAAQLTKVKNIIESDSSRRVVVVSAAGKRSSDDHKITDLLYLCYAHIKYGVEYDSIYDIIRQRYIEIKKDLGLKTDIEDVLDEIEAKMKSGISQDELVSRGEYLAARLMADLLGYDFLDSSLWLKFKFDGSIDQEKSYEALKRLAADRRVVIPGFYGAMPDGTIKVLARGGSDITGALAAAALDADVYENWTDVSGILMADPRIVKNPKPIERVTYDELRELSYIGAQVLHEATIFPVKEKNIALNIRNTNEPDHPGTLIMDKFDDSLDSDERVITGIAGRRNFTTVTVARTGLSSEIGGLRRILEIFEKHGISVEYVPSGIDSVSLVVSAEKVAPCLYSILGEIEREYTPDDISVTENLAIVAAVGRRMAQRLGTSGKIFATLGENGVNIRMISQGPDELNIIVGVENKDFEHAIQVLYDNFVK
ncbi:MAG: aspartate kinase [Firmicutes bacterium]|nr:aspartate kinase [Bacillota bacterium]